nr:outer membrane beta-barrel protein [Cytophagales bacterium]
MKNIHKLFVLTLGALLVMVIPSVAQVSLDHVGIGVSYWNRSYSGADERSFLVNYPGDGGFSQGAAIPQVSAGLLLFDGFGIDGRIGIWSATFSEELDLTGGLRISESIKQTVIPLTTGVYYSISNVVPDKMNVLVGAGVNRYFIQNTSERTVSAGEGSVAARTFNGNDYGAYGKLGIEYLLGDVVSVVLDGRYNTGSYDKTYIPEFAATPVTRNVSMMGLEIGLSLRYKFVKSDANSEE